MVNNILNSLGIYDLIVFLLIFSVTYGLMKKFKYFETSDIPALIAAAIALTALTSSFFTSFLLTLMPFVLVILVFMFLVILLLSTALIPQDSIVSYLKKSTLVPAIVIFMMFVFGLISFGTVLGQSPAVAAGSSGTSTVAATSASLAGVFPTDLSAAYIMQIFTTPSFLSLILTMIAMTIAMLYITKEERRS